MRFPLLVSSILAPLSLIACGGDVEPAKSPEPDASQQAAESADQSAERAEDKADRAADKAEDAADEAKKANEAP
jgi:hypothetical protein